MVQYQLLRIEKLVEPKRNVLKSRRKLIWRTIIRMFELLFSLLFILFESIKFLVLVVYIIYCDYS